MHIDPEISGCSIVLAGKLNPAIFHPAWLIAHDIERGVTVEDASVEIVHQDISKFSIGSRSYLIEKFRFQVQTAEAPWIALSDIASQIFGELLVHTPIEAFGINRDIHFNVKDAEARKKIGRSLAPIEPWGEFGAGMENEDGNLGGGLYSLTMRRSTEEGAYSLQTNAKIQPSAQLHALTGIFMQINFHHQIKELKDGYGARPAIEVLQGVFQKRIDESDQIFETIMRMG